MKFTIGTVSNSIDFSEDLQLIKSSLLYADEIELIGMVEYAILCYLPAMIQGSRDIFSLCEGIRPLLKAIDNSETREVEAQIESVMLQIEPFKRILTKKRHRNKLEITAQLKMKQEMKKVMPVIEEQLVSILNTKGANQLLDLANGGIITIHDYKYRDFDQSVLAGGYFGTLLRTMQDDTAFPLFDKISN